MKRFFILLTTIIVLGSSLFSAWFDDLPITITQPNGLEMSVFASGDEFHHWLHDADKFTIIQDPATGY
ncbi:MAG: hypothetical protein FWG20_00915, partial [Candidatus Cloacimonetes bacterium]|nr:hypothetical protein [Candidatus Cloacimonadota bacterium]